MDICDKVIKSFRPAYYYEAPTKIFSTCFDYTGNFAAALGTKKIFLYKLIYDQIETLPVELKRNSYKHVLMPQKTPKSNYYLYSYMEKYYHTCQMDLGSQNEIMTFNAGNNKIISMSISSYDPSIFLVSNCNNVALFDVKSVSDPILKIDTGFKKNNYANFVMFKNEFVLINSDAKSNYISTYDIRNLKEPKYSAEFSIANEANWTSVQTSVSNEDTDTYMVITTNNEKLMLYKINGKKLETLHGCDNERKEHRDACILPNSQFVMCGDSKGIIHFWNIGTGQKIAKLKGEKIDSNIHKVLFNPALMLFTSLSSKLLTFWIEEGN